MTLPTLAITGGTGFVGRILITMAVAKGWHVRALTRSTQMPEKGVTWVAGALDKPESLAALVSGTDAVLHVAGVVNATTRAEFEASNIMGTSALLDAARDASVRRFIYVSSLTARRPELSNYGWSKAQAENIVAASALEWTIVRPPWIYGPGDKDTLDIFKAARGGLVPLPPNGHISVLHVADLARLLLALVDAPEAGAQVYEPDDGSDDWTNASFIRAIGLAFNRRVTVLHLPKAVLLIGAHIDKLFRRSRAKLTNDRVNYMAHPDWRVDPTRRPPATIWQPLVNTHTGVKTTLADYRERKWL